MLDQWTFWREIENAEVESFGQEVLLLFGVELVFGCLLIGDAVERFSDVLGGVGLAACELLAGGARLSLRRALMRRLSAASEGRLHRLQHALIRVIQYRPAAFLHYRLLISLFFIIHINESLLCRHTKVGNHRQQHDFGETILSNIVILTLRKAQFRYGCGQIGG